MFYCEACRLKNSWPKALIQSTGSCECCGARANCWGRPSNTLPSPKLNAAAMANEEWPFEASELKIDIFRPGGQTGWLNTVDHAVCIIHLPSGLSVEHSDDRSQHRNKAEAMKKLIPLVQAWKEAGAQAPAKPDGVTAALEDIKKMCQEGIEASYKLALVRAAVTKYYDAMVQRQHGGVAMSQAMNEIEQIFGLHYDTYRDSQEK